MLRIMIYVYVEITEREYLPDISCRLLLPALKIHRRILALENSVHFGFPTFLIFLVKLSEVAYVIAFYLYSLLEKKRLHSGFLATYV